MLYSSIAGLPANYTIVPSGFEPESSAPKANRIDHYPTGLFFIPIR